MSGSRSPLKTTQGFTLIEILLSIAILSAGLVVINQTMLASVTALSYVENRTEANTIMSNKIWEANDQALRQKKSFKKSDSGVVASGAKKFDYVMSPAATGDGQWLFPQQITLGWEQTGRQKSISRAFSIWIPHEKKS